MSMHGKVDKKDKGGKVTKTVEFEGHIDEKTWLEFLEELKRILAKYHIKIK